MNPGDYIHFTFSHDDGPGTPVRQEEHEGHIVLLLPERILSDGVRLQLLVVETDDGQRYPIRTDQVVPH